MIVQEVGALLVAVPLALVVLASLLGWTVSGAISLAGRQASAWCLTSAAWGLARLARHQ